jgi:hypothetical protein
MVNELTLRLELSADVLIHEDVTLTGEVVVGTELVAVVIEPVRRDAVCGARHQEGIPLARVARLVKDREQPDPVAHGNVQLALGVVSARIEPRLGRDERQR